MSNLSPDQSSSLNNRLGITQQLNQVDSTVNLSALSQSVVSISPAENGKVLRQVRSFVRRQGRLTKGQEMALLSYWPTMGIEYKPELFNWHDIFGNNSPVTLEIGFGMGASLVEMAKANPEQNFLGIEVHLPGVGACLSAAQEVGVKNLRVMCHDAIEVLNFNIPDNSLAMIQLFFPDPWHKARHHKRRIVQAEFVELIANKLKVGGVFHKATDWEEYAFWSLDILKNSSRFKNLSQSDDFVPRPVSRPVTKFEQRGHRLGHGVWDLMFTKKS